MVRGQSKVLII